VTLAAEKRLVYEDKVQIPRLYIEWPSVGNTNDDNYALDMLGAVLSGPRTARLTKALVYDRQSAAQVGASQSSDENVGEFGVTITPRPGHTLTELELAADSIIDRIKKEGPTDEELQRAKASAELQFLGGLESNLNKAAQLAEGQAYDNNPAQFKVDYRKAQAVTGADVKRVANKYLGKGRVVLSVVPVGKKDQASKPDQSVTVSANGTIPTMGTGTKR